MIRQILAGGLVLTLNAAGAAGAQQAIDARGAVLRGLDKVSGQTIDITLDAGQSAPLGPLTITLRNCRYPVSNPTSDAYAGLEITADGGASKLFDGWMIASSPALSALDHPRYDIWVIRCTTS